MDVSAHVTVILTTSPVRSHPSTYLIESAFESFKEVTDLQLCRKIVVFDGYDVHSVKNEKRGRISSDMSDNYQEYISRVRLLIESHPAFENTSCLVLEERHGFGFAVKAALSMVTTPYVLILQHDFIFCQRVNLPALVRVLHNHPIVQYIGLLSAATERYALARSHGPQTHMVLPTEYFDGEPFVKLMFWYDKAHLARVAYYFAQVFGPRTCIRKGQFIEDTFGHWELKKLALEGMSAHVRFGTYLWYPNNGADRCIQHLQGRKFHIEEVKDALYPERAQHKNLKCVLKNDREVLDVTSPVTSVVA